MMEQIVKTSRSYRRFHEDRPVDIETLKGLVNLARLAPSGGNIQPLKYMVSADPDLNRRIFPALAWAGYLPDWSGPVEGERPAAYIVILGDTEISKNFATDQGIAAQTIMLGAASQGLGGCMFGSINRDMLRDVLAIPDRYEILLVLALGYPKEKVVIEEVGPGESIKYYRDQDGTHYVPKRRLEDIILG